MPGVFSSPTRPCLPHPPLPPVLHPLALSVLNTPHVFVGSYIFCFFCLESAPPKPTNQPNQAPLLTADPSGPSVLCVTVLSPERPPLTTLHVHFTLGARSRSLVSTLSIACLPGLDVLARFSRAGTQPFLPAVEYLVPRLTVDTQCILVKGASESKNK